MKRLYGVVLLLGLLGSLSFGKENEDTLEPSTQTVGQFQSVSLSTYRDHVKNLIAPFPLHLQEREMLIRMVDSIPPKLRGSIMPAWSYYLQFTPVSSLQKELRVNIIGGLVGFPGQLAEIPSSLHQRLTTVLVSLSDSYFMGGDSCLEVLAKLRDFAPEERREEWLDFLEEKLNNFHQVVNMFEKFQEQSQDQRQEEIIRLCQQFGASTETFDVHGWLIGS